jgi:hypothetical protein
MEYGTPPPAEDITSSLAEARRFFPSMTDQQLTELIEATDFFQNRLLDDYLKLNDYEEERYNKK